MDVRLPGITAEGETARSLGPAATGILTVVGPFHVEVVADALQALVVERKGARVGTVVSKRDHLDHDRRLKARA